MDYNFKAFDSHGHYNHLLPTSSFNHTYISDQPLPATIDGLWTGRSVGPADMRREFEAVQRELEKERIRNEILAEEAERRRILKAEVRRELIIEYEITAAPRIGAIPSPVMLGQHLHAHRYQFQPEKAMILPGELFSPENRVPTPESYGGSVAVQIRRQTQPECIGLGKYSGSGSKRKAPEPTTKGDYSCAVCNISATSKRGLQEHLFGKKHLAKVAGMKANDKKVMARRKKGKKNKRAGKKGKKHQKQS